MPTARNRTYRSGPTAQLTTMGNDPPWHLCLWPDSNTSFTSPYQQRDCMDPSEFTTSRDHHLDKLSVSHAGGYEGAEGCRIFC